VSLEEDHAQVAKALLEANPVLTGKVFRSKVPDPTPALPWVLLYTRVAFPRDGIGTSITAVQGTITTTVTCHCAAESEAAAFAIRAQVRTSLLNVRPAISGRNCGPIKEADAQDPIPDESLGQLIEDAVVVFDFSTTG
jgi:hypothetical protein